MLLDASGIVLIADFLALVTNDDPPKKVWEHALEKVKNPFYTVGRGNCEAMIARVFIMMHGYTNEVKELSNRVIVDWQCVMKKKKYKEGECPYYSPAVQNMLLRVFFAIMKDRYNFQFVIGDFKKFKGSLSGVMRELYAQRRKDWVSLITR